MLVETWKSLPAPLARVLAVSSVGPSRLVGLAQDVRRLAATAALSQVATAATSQITNAATPQDASPHTDLAFDLLFAAWDEDPLNGSLAAALAQKAASAPDGTPARPTADLDLFSAVARHWAAPADTRYTDRLIDRGDFSKLRAHIERQQQREPGNPYWPQMALLAAHHGGDWDWALERLEQISAHTLPASIINLLRARVLLLLDRPGEALPLLEPLADPARRARWAGPLVLLGEARLRLCGADGNPHTRKEAFAAWADALRARPWHASLALALHDRLKNLDTPAPPTPDGAPLPGSLRILFYSWNKADELHDALTSVAASITRYTPGSVSITLLDNGSTDATGLVVSTWADRFAGLFESVRLPVNVGAPAARNWLANMDSVRSSDFALYLDDDAEVPADWLGRFAAALGAYPDSSVWGCRVVDHAVPTQIQNADLHLALAGDFGTGCPDPTQNPNADPNAVLRAEYQPGRITSAPFDVSNAHAQVSDTGLFSYVRPCASVTGCCHLMRTSALSRGFNLALSPSQYDDLERDLCELRDGGHACYQGFLAVRHKRGAGARAADFSQLGNSLANKYKLHHLFQADEVLAMRDAIDARVQRDLLEKLQALDEILDEFLTE